MEGSVVLQYSLAAINTDMSECLSPIYVRLSLNYHDICMYYMSFTQLRSSPAKPLKFETANKNRVYLLIDHYY